MSWRVIPFHVWAEEVPNQHVQPNVASIFMVKVKVLPELLNKAWMWSVGLSKDPEFQIYTTTSIPKKSAAIDIRV